MPLGDAVWLTTKGATGPDHHCRLKIQWQGKRIELPSLNRLLLHCAKRTTGIALLWQELYGSHRLQQPTRNRLLNVTHLYSRLHHTRNE